MTAIVGFWLLGFLPLFIGCMCCGTGINCGDCSGTPENWRIVLSGITDGTLTECDESFNGTHDLALCEDLSSLCRFAIDVGNYSMTFAISTDSTPQVTGAALQLFEDNLSGCVGSVALATYGGAIAGDCDTTSHAMALSFDSGGCATLPDPVTANAI